MGRVEGKRAILTGAASGIGRATAELFAREGFDATTMDAIADRAGTSIGSRDGVSRGDTSLTPSSSSGDAKVTSRSISKVWWLGARTLSSAR